MNPLKRWNQLNELEALQHRSDNLFCGSQINRLGDYERAVHRIPLVGISEEEKEYRIKAELPEVKKEDVKVTVQEGTLIITGDREFEVNCKKNHRVERAYGRFLHSFLLPQDASSAEVSAEFEDGVLTVHLLKHEKAKTQRVEVKVS